MQRIALVITDPLVLKGMVEVLREKDPEHKIAQIYTSHTHLVNMSALVSVELERPYDVVYHVGTCSADQHHKTSEILSPTKALSDDTSYDLLGVDDTTLSTDLLFGVNTADDQNVTWAIASLCEYMEYTTHVGSVLYVGNAEDMTHEHFTEIYNRIIALSTLLDCM